MKSLLKLGSYLVISLVVSFATPKLHYKLLRSHVAQYVVKITNQEGTSGGTGVHIVAPSGKPYILTNAHVCNGVKDKSDSVMIDNGYFQERRKIVEISKFSDLCLVEALYSNGLSVRTTEAYQEIVYTIGHPRLMPTTLVSGELIGRGMAEVQDDSNPACDGPNQIKRTFPTFFGPVEVCVNQLSANYSNIVIRPGNSGSPLVDSFGRLIGLAYAGDSEVHWGIFVPASNINKFLEKY